MEFCFHYIGAAAKRWAHWRDSGCRAFSFEIASLCAILADIELCAKDMDPGALDLRLRPLVKCSRETDLCEGNKISMFL